MVKNYVPARGDIILINFNPQSGREQAGKRPALVISDFSYNKATGLALACPITRQIKNYPFEVLISHNSNTKGVILSDQIKCLDWKKRRAKYIEKITPVTLIEVIQKIQAIIIPG